MRLTALIAALALTITSGCSDEGGDDDRRQITSPDSGMQQQIDPPDFGNTPRPDMFVGMGGAAGEGGQGGAVGGAGNMGGGAPDAEPPPMPDAGPPPPDMDPQTPDAEVPPDLPPDPNVNAGWIGGPCSNDGDCDYDEGYCLQDDEGYPRGMCSLDCERVCPDRDGMPVTFCIGEVVDGGACVQRCDYNAFDTGCRPGYRCETRGRFSEPDTRRGVCVPGSADIDPPPVMGCIAEIERLGMNYALAGQPGESPAGRGDLECTIDTPIMLRSPVNGVSYRYVTHDTPQPMYVSCDLAAALHELSALLRESDIVEVGHIGTYHCRVISGTDTLSEHGRAAAIDIKWFRTADGEIYDVEDHWEHDTRNFSTEKGEWLFNLGQQMFNRGIFNIVLTPNFNAAHDNHFHVDLTPGGSFIRKDDGHHHHGHFGPNPHGD
ncbi:MAG: extensin family protein [Bradymonadia bacterium]